MAKLPKRATPGSNEAIRQRLTRKLRANPNLLEKLAAAERLHGSGILMVLAEIGPVSKKATVIDILAATKDQREAMRLIREANIGPALIKRPRKTS